MLFTRFVLKICWVTLARVPFDFVIAVSITTRRLRGVDRVRVRAPLSAFVNAIRNALPWPLSCEFGTPATLTYAPSAAAPAPSTTAEIGVKPSGRISLTLRTERGRRSLISLPPFSQTSEPTKTPATPVSLIFEASAS